jgi:hypothetical protein
LSFCVGVINLRSCHLRMTLGSAPLCTNNRNKEKAQVRPPTQFNICAIKYKPWTEPQLTSAQPQVNLSLLRRNSVKFLARRELGLSYVRTAKTYQEVMLDIPSITTACTLYTVLTSLPWLVGQNTSKSIFWLVFFTSGCAVPVDNITSLLASYEYLTCF